MAGRIAYYGNIVKDGLILDLDAAKRDSYPGSGTTWFDIGGLQYNGTLTNGPTFNSSNGGSIVFDGTNDYVNCGTFEIGNPKTISVSCWIKPAVNTGRNDFVSKWDTGNNTPNTRTFNLLHGVTNGKFQFFISTDGTNILNSGTSTTNITPGVWYFVTGIYDGSFIRLYINGIQENFTAQTGDLYWINTRTLIIGGNIGDNPPRYTNGNIAQTLIYNRALSATEVLQNYNALKGRYL